MKCIVWVFGSSASGKETFLHVLQTDSHLRSKIGIETALLAISQQSLKNLGDLDSARSSIQQEVAKLIQSHDTVGIKWQYGDSMLNTPNQIRVAFPDIQHVAVILDVDPDEQIRRLQTKLWWHDIGKETDFISKERRLIEKSMKDLHRDFIQKEIQW